MVEAFLWGAFAASSLLLGAAIAIARTPHRRMLGMVMGFGAGVLLSAVSFELIAKAIAASGGLEAAMAGFFVGAGVFGAGDALIARSGYAHRKDISGAPPDATGMAIVLGALLDGIPESAVLGLTLVATGEIGAAMLVAVFVSNVPEGIAATASLRSGGWSTRGLLALWGSMALAAGVAAALGFAMLDGASPEALAFVLAFAAGAILAMLSTSMMPEAYEHAGRVVGIVTTFGFALALVVNWLEA
ncbi:MAG: ZIP family zinc transporter [Actinobacteria bacterium]|nr:MAG: ZIP family zinc transporter [Actinomycetota bacterium]